MRSIAVKPSGPAASPRGRTRASRRQPPYNSPLATPSGNTGMKQRTSFGQLTLDREYFVSQDVFAAEHERIFLRSWLLAGHVSQLEEPGSYFLFEIERESVIVVRDRDGKIHALHNHCRHRGSRLCHEVNGKLGQVILCPYHAWS